MGEQGTEQLVTRFLDSEYGNKHTKIFLIRCLFVYNIYTLNIYIYIYLGRSVCESARSIRVLYTALLCSRHQAPSRCWGDDESVQCVRLPIHRRTLIRTFLKTFRTRYYIRLSEQNGKLYDQTNHGKGGRAIQNGHSTPMVLSNVFGWLTRLGDGGGITTTIGSQW